MLVPKRHQRTSVSQERLVLCCERLKGHKQFLETVINEPDLTMFLSNAIGDPLEFGPNAIAEVNVPVSPEKIMSLEPEPGYAGQMLIPLLIEVDHSGSAISQLIHPMCQAGYALLSVLNNEHLINIVRMEEHALDLDVIAFLANVRLIGLRLGQQVEFLLCSYQGELLLWNLQVEQLVTHSK
jgi:hypothetical protein